MTPLLIGITGHRDINIDSIEAVEEEIKRFLKNTQSLLPNTPITLMSGMADGADRLSVKVALELDIAVQAVLPMPLDLYETDFSSSSKEELHGYLNNKNVELIELPLPEGMNAEKVESPGPDRDQLYLQLGKYLVKRSGLMLALWDGINTGLMGGTSDVLLRYLNVNDTEETNISFTEQNENLPDDSEVVFWIPVDRGNDKNTDQISTKVKGKYLLGHIGGGCLIVNENMPSTVMAELAYLDEYNFQHEEIVNNGKFFSWGGMLENVPDFKKRDDYDFLKNLDDEYQKADGLALYNQKFSDQTFKWFAFMAGFMGLLFLFYAKILPAKIFLIGYLALFLLGLWMNKKTANQQWFAKHLAQRVIAETLRTKFFLIMAGVDRQVDIRKMLNLTGISQFSGFSWIKRVFKNYEPIESNAKNIGKKNDDLDFVSNAWIKDQAKYFKSKIDKLSHEHHKLEKIKTRLLIASAVSVVLLILFKKTLVSISIVGSLDMKTLLVFLMGLLPFWLGVWEIYQGKMAIKELLWQYRNQSNNFRLAEVKIENSKNTEAQKEVLINLGEKSIMENYLWTIHRYHREHEPPTAG